jgi:hypothetical protein
MATMDTKTPKKIAIRISMAVNPSVSSSDPMYVRSTADKIAKVVLVPTIIPFVNEMIDVINLLLTYLKIILNEEMLVK